MTVLYSRDEVRALIKSKVLETAIAFYSNEKDDKLLPMLKSLASLTDTLEACLEMDKSKCQQT